MSDLSRGRKVLLSTTLEEQWQDWVMDQAALGGWHGAHIRVSHRSLEGLHGKRRAFPRGADHDDAFGIPDLVLVQPERKILLLPELKTMSGRLSGGQELWLKWLAQVMYVQSPVWRPQDEGEVRAMLRG
jgi:hypothetical protein